MKLKILCLEALLLVGCAARPQAAEHLVATDPAPANEETIPWTKEMGHVDWLGTSPLPEVTTEFRTTAKEGVKYFTKVKCIITVEGLVRGCAIEESVPSMDQVVLRWLGVQRYSTPLVDGARRQFSYVFIFAFTVAPLSVHR